MRAEECANGDGSAVTRCVGCRAPLCDRCATWEINGAHWCEPCGRRTEEKIRPRIGTALGVFVSGLGAIALAVCIDVLDFTKAAIAIVALFGFSARVSWPFTGQMPTVRRRHLAP